MGAAGDVNHAGHAGHLEPKPTVKTYNGRSLAKANSLKLVLVLVLVIDF